ncbi:1c3a947a-10e7-4be3-8464-a0e16ee22746 [Sclerotinia trifoliorum]|uniref:1c3a947a-10e7-4be3-8464-a0e16ee22746 n=1 Tax=Sclerotinia trifoliorum TaxID=28548 RepID=A0A8H2ZLW8_9HELO|nr:1c3a947a-10e7-4be3-8464-a0e16ee22746 [Sclerotinia trifoliorum]
MSPSAIQNNGSRANISSASSPIHTIPLIINNEPYYSSNTFPVFSPIDNSHLHNCVSASASDIDLALNTAQAAYPAWRTLPPPQKRDIFLRAAEILLERKPLLEEIMHKETGSEAIWANFNTDTSREGLLDVAGRLSSIAGSIPMTSEEGRSALVYKEPYGVILGAAPWNAPYILGFRSVMNALAVGNCAILKASEFSPMCSWQICDIFHKAGLPKGVLTLVAISVEDAPARTAQLIESPIIKKINFTGSTRVGKIYGELAGKNLKPIVLELGGKASVIVWEDADLKLAATECAKGAFLNSGQICMSTERVLVHKNVAVEFEKAFAAATAEMFSSSGTLINPQGVSRNASLISDSLSKGGSILHGTAPAENSPPTTKMAPVILKSVTPSMSIYREESFGPTVSVIEISTEEEAIRISNDTDYGLSAGIYTRDLQRGLRMARAIESGAVHINGYNGSIHDEPCLPHGGMKNSGFGRFGASGLEEWVRTKTVTFKN